MIVLVVILCCPVVNYWSITIWSGPQMLVAAMAMRLLATKAAQGGP